MASFIVRRPVLAEFGENVLHLLGVNLPIPVLSY